MSWEEKILGVEELRPYLPSDVGGDGLAFRRLAQALIDQQMATWPMLREAVAGLGRVEYKQLLARGSEALAQFNPQRIVSTAAKVDAATIRQRPCFLCAENLPAEERGIRFGDDFVALCNPFPVLHKHLVITSRRHIPQTIDGNFGTLLDLAMDLGDEYFVLYNGARCGASAPDHLHFQACERKLLPIIRDVERWDRRELPADSGMQTFTLQGYRLNALIACGNDRKKLMGWFDTALRSLAEVTSVEDEPMINLVVTWGGDHWTVIVFPRSKHRPDRYFAEDESKLTVSPAAIDLSGVLVVPQPEHFARITSRDVEEIYAEVTLGDELFNTWLRAFPDSKRS
jgi:hypothetical protein